MRRRVRFLVHVMGAPGPVACFLEGELAELEEDAYFELARRRTMEGGPWILEAPDEEGRECLECERTFATGALDAHREFYHRARQEEPEDEPGVTVTRVGWRSRGKWSPKPDEDEEHVAVRAVRARNSRYPRGEGHIVCIACGRRFATRSAFKCHRTLIHDWTEGDHETTEEAIREDRTSSLRGGGATGGG